MQERQNAPSRIQNGPVQDPSKSGNEPRALGQGLRRLKRTVLHISWPLLTRGLSSWLQVALLYDRHLVGIGEARRKRLSQNPLRGQHHSQAERRRWDWRRGTREERQVWDYLWSGYIRDMALPTVWALCASQSNRLSHFSAALFLPHRQPSHAPHTPLTPTLQTDTQAHRLQSHKHIKHGNPDGVILCKVDKCSMQGPQRHSWGQSLVLPIHRELPGLTKHSLKTRETWKLTDTDSSQSGFDIISLQNLPLWSVDTP